ncbi:TetR family transcriptional regulator [Allostella vacuolata]|nr:TetR family transcriptional regulator [Stella vacuolata]
MANARVTAIDRRRTDTRDRILDAAEKLFSERGYDGVSIRDITQLAGAGLALMTYHFGTKDRLFECVLERRAEVLNRDRLAALDAVLARQNPTVGELLSGFVEPYVRYGSGPDAGWRHYCRLIAIVGPTGRWSELLGRLFDSTAEKFIAALTRIEPGLDEERATRAFLFCVGTMVTSFTGNPRLDRLTKRMAIAADLNRTFDYLIPFIAGGVAAIADLAEREAPPPSPRRRSK